MMMPASYWIGVASREHVRLAVRGGFCQLCHGKALPLRRLNAGDWLFYYSPRQTMGADEKVQAFTALGKVAPGEPYQYDMGGGFAPFRRTIEFLPVREAPINPLLPLLSFTQGRTSWGYAFRRGMFKIERADYIIISAAMGLAQATGDDAAAAVG